MLACFCFQANRFRHGLVAPLLAPLTRLTPFCTFCIVLSIVSPLLARNVTILPRCLLELKNVMQETSETLHPRPQLTRTRWIDLDGPWGFTHDDDACGLDEHWQEQEEVFTRKIQVPFPPESSASGIGDNGFHAIVWYRRTFEVSPDVSTLRDRYGSPEAIERTLHGVQPGSQALILPGYRRDGQPIMLTEFGGIAYQPEGNERPGFGYCGVPDSESFLARYRELLDAILNSTAIAGFCYTQLTDVEREMNGLLTEHRVPKLNTADVYAITSRASAAVAGETIAQVQQAQSITSS
jgi:hypothetical protein